MLPPFEKKKKKKKKKKTEKVRKMITCSSTFLCRLSPENLKYPCLYASHSLLKCSLIS